MQRGGADVSTPGNPKCYKKVGPCGSPTPEHGTVTNLSAGSTFTVEFEQNLNHYDNDNPGSLAIDFAPTCDPSEGDFHLLLPPISDFNAMNEISRVNFTVDITVPQSIGAGVLRARYISNNPDENDRGMIFYQCADVSISAGVTKQVIGAETSRSKTSGAGPTPVGGTVAAKPQPSPDATAGSAPWTASNACCAPSSFTTSFKYDHPNSKGIIYYDAKAKMMRTDVVSGDGTSGTTDNGSFRMYSNFTSGIEWYYNVVTNECAEYGLDFWNDWCFGDAGSSETWTSDGACPSGSETSSEVCHFYRNGPWQFSATTDGCFPRSMVGSPSGSVQQAVYYLDSTEGPIDPSIFKAPAVCKPGTAAANGSGPTDNHDRHMSHLRNLVR